MSDQGQWQLAGNAAETYERALVPALFAAWAPLVVALPTRGPASASWTLPAAPASSPDSRRSGWVGPGMSSVST
jgi:hypothetical protein